MDEREIMRNNEVATPQQKEVRREGEVIVAIKR